MLKSVAPAHTEIEIAPMDLLQERLRQTAGCLSVLDCMLLDRVRPDCDEGGLSDEVLSQIASAGAALLAQAQEAANKL